jgi:hypothetical protein
MSQAPELAAPSFLARSARELFPVAVLLAVCAKCTHDNWRAFDLTPTDEISYALHGKLLGTPLASELDKDPLFVPLYAAWYRALDQLPVAPEFLPHLSQALLLSALALLMYALLRRLGTGRAVAVLAASVLVLNTRFADISPFPHHLATALLALGALVGTFQRSALAACGPVAFGALAAVYVRNEFATILLGLLPLYLLAGLRACRSGEGRRAFLPWAVPFGCALAACHFTLGLSAPTGQRGTIAFVQHFVRNAAEVEGRGHEAWNYYLFEEFEKSFGGAKTMGEAVRARPDLVAWHLWRNVSRAPAAARAVLIPRAPFGGTCAQPARLLTLFAVCAGLFLCARRAIREGASPALKAVLLAALPALGATGAAAVVIYPREHYFVPALFFLLALAASGWPAPKWPARFGAPTGAKRAAVALVGAALLLATAPTARNGATLLEPLFTKHRWVPTFELRETTTLLRELGLPPGARVMNHHQALWLVVIWMDPPIVYVFPDGTDGFRAFCERTRVDVLVLNPEMVSHARFKDDADFRALCAETACGPFEIRRTPSGVRVAVRTASVPPGK